MQGDADTEYTVNNKGRLMIGQKGKRHKPTGHVVINAEALNHYLKEVETKQKVLDTQYEIGLQTRNKLEEETSDLKKEVSELEKKVECAETACKEIKTMSQEQYDTLKQEYQTIEGKNEVLEQTVKKLKKENKQTKDDILNDIKEQGYKISEDGRIIPIDADEKDKKIAELEAKLAGYESNSAKAEPDKYERIVEILDAHDEFMAAQIEQGIDDLFDAYIAESNAKKPRTQSNGLYDIIEIPSKIITPIRNVDGKEVPVNHFERGVPYMLEVVTGTNLNQFNQYLIFMDIEITDPAAKETLVRTVKADNPDRIRQIGKNMDIKSNTDSPVYLNPDDELAVKCYALVKKESLINGN